jgi:hypothetical protein
MYYSFIFPYLLYCYHVWGNTYATNLQRLVVLQKKAIIIICFAPFRSHTADLFEQLSILKFHDIHTYLISIFMMRAVSVQALNVYKGVFIYNFELHSKNTRSSLDLHLPKVSSDLGKMLIKYEECVIWNKKLN